MQEKGKGAGSPAERKIVDPTGLEWRIKEMTVWYADGTAKRSLVASHTSGFRRIWDFPPNWENLADSELAMLVAKRVPSKGEAAG